jgi:transcriptional regulator with XRE-family HTH domain
MRPFCHLTLRTLRLDGQAFVTIWKSIGKLIKERRNTLKLTQERCAEILGVRKETLRNWERTRHVAERRFRPKIVEFLGFDPLRLITSASRP